MRGTSGDREIFTWEERVAAWNTVLGNLLRLSSYLGKEIEISAGKLLLHHLRYFDADTFFLVLQ